MDEATELFRLCGPAFKALFGAAAGYECCDRPAGVLALSGEPLIDLNVMLIATDCGAAAFLREGAGRAAMRGLPLMVIISSAVSASVKGVAGEIGLTPSGSLPLMVLRGAADLKTGVGGVTVERVIKPEGRRLAGDLISSAFSLPRRSVASVLEASMALQGGVEVYLARRDPGAASSVSIAINGRTASVWSMATPPEYRGQGLGGALLADVTSRLRRRGIDRIFLFASTDGRRLYENLGFETLCDCSVWVRPVRY